MNSIATRGLWRSGFGYKHQRTEGKYYWTCIDTKELALIGSVYMNTTWFGVNG